MSTQLKKLFMVIVALGVLFTATTIAAPAQAAPGPSDKISISADRQTCTVTAKLQWKNYDTTTFQYAHVVLYRGGAKVDETYSAGGLASGTITASFVETSTLGYPYYAIGAVYTVGGGAPPVLETHSLTLRCRL